MNNCQQENTDGNDPAKSKHACVLGKRVCGRRGHWDYKGVINYCERVLEYEAWVVKGQNNVICKRVYLARGVGAFFVGERGT